MTRCQNVDVSTRGRGYTPSVVGELSTGVGVPSPPDGLYPGTLPETVPRTLYRGLPRTERVLPGTSQVDPGPSGPPQV